MVDHLQTLPKILEDRFGYSEFRPGQMKELKAERILALTATATPPYATYKIKTLLPVNEVVNKFKLTRHELFGALEEYRFADVLGWCGRS